MYLKYILSCRNIALQYGIFNLKNRTNQVKIEI